MTKVKKYLSCLKGLEEAKVNLIEEWCNFCKSNQEYGKYFKKCGKDYMIFQCPKHHSIRIEIEGSKLVAFHKEKHSMVTYIRHDVAEITDFGVVAKRINEICER